MKKLLFVLLIFGVCFAIDDYVKPVTYSPQAVLTASQLNSSADTNVVQHDRLRDTLDAEFIRFSDLEGGDSTISRLLVDTAVIDTASILKLDLGTFIGNPTGDSLTLTYINITDSAVIAKEKVVASEITTLSVDNINSNPTIDSADITYINVTDSAIIEHGSIDTCVVNKLTVGAFAQDSAIGLEGIRSANDVLAGNDVTATNDVNATNDVIGDSLVGTTGIRTPGTATGLNIIATNDVAGDSLIATTGSRTVGSSTAAKLIADSISISDGGVVNLDTTFSKVSLSDIVRLKDSTHYTILTDTARTNTTLLTLFSENGQATPDTVSYCFFGGVGTEDVNEGDLLIVNSGFDTGTHTIYIRQGNATGAKSGAFVLASEIILDNPNSRATFVYAGNRWVLVGAPSQH